MPRPASSTCRWVICSVVSAASLFLINEENELPVLSFLEVKAYAARCRRCTRMGSICPRLQVPDILQINNTQIVGMKRKWSNTPPAGIICMPSCPRRSTCLDSLVVVARFSSTICRILVVLLPPFQTVAHLTFLFLSLTARFIIKICVNIGKFKSFLKILYW